MKSSMRCEAMSTEDITYSPEARAKVNSYNRARLPRRNNPQNVERKRRQIHSPFLPFSAAAVINIQTNDKLLLVTTLDSWTTVLIANRLSILLGYARLA